MLQAKQKGKIEISNSSGTMQAIRLINSLDHYEPTNVSSMFEFWKNHDSKTLSKLAKVVIALPTTQVSVERLFSGIKYMSDLKNGLTESTLEAIMFQLSNRN